MLVLEVLDHPSRELQVVHVLILAPEFGEVRDLQTTGQLQTKRCHASHETLNGFLHRAIQPELPCPTEMIGQERHAEAGFHRAWRTCDECEIRRSDIIVEHALHSLDSTDEHER